MGSIHSFPIAFYNLTLNQMNYPQIIVRTLVFSIFIILWIIISIRSKRSRKSFSLLAFAPHNLLYFIDAGGICSTIYDFAYPDETNIPYTILAVICICGTYYLFWHLIKRQNK